MSILSDLSQEATTPMTADITPPIDLEFALAIAEMPEPLTRPEAWALHDVSGGIFTVDTAAEARWQWDIDTVLPEGQVSDMHFLAELGLISIAEPDADGVIWCTPTTECIMRAQVAAKLTAGVLHDRS